MNYLGNGRWPFDVLWRKDLRDAYVVLEPGVSVREWYQGAFATQDEAEIGRAFMHIYNPDIQFHVARITNVALTECKTVFDLLSFRLAKDDVARGNERVKTVLALCYAYGHEVTRDLDKAGRLFKERAAASDEDAISCRTILKRTFLPEFADRL